MKEIHVQTKKWKFIFFGLNLKSKQSQNVETFNSQNMEASLGLKGKENSRGDQGATIPEAWSVQQLEVRGIPKRQRRRQSRR